MPRNRKSAKAAGARFEKLIADHLATNLDDRIERRVVGGTNDRGDIGGVRTPDGRRVVIECKDHGGRLQPAQWVKEAHIEATNDGTDIGLVIAKRRGTTNPADQWVITTVEDLTRLLK